MDLYFRKLEEHDVPSILEISKDIWEGEDYIPHVINNWLKEKTAFNFGVFKDALLENLVAFGRVRLFRKDLAWLEGGRVKNVFQKQGIRREIMKFALDYCEKIGVKVVQYDTASQNKGSIALAKDFKFKKKKTMDLVEVEYKKLSFSTVKYLKTEEIGLNKAKEFYKTIDIGPGDEVCIGWSFVPLNHLKNRNSSWFRSNNAILHKINAQSENGDESPENDEVWLIVYGDHQEAFYLIQNVLSRKISSHNIKNIEVFCQIEVVEKLKNIGFSYWDNEQVQVILFEKKLN